MEVFIDDEENILRALYQIATHYEENTKKLIVSSYRAPDRIGLPS